MTKLEIDSNNGRDLYAQIECSCLDKRWEGSSIYHIMKTKIKFTGYNDDYFFKVVNKEPREQVCDCGRVFIFQWKEDGVYVEDKK